MSEKAHVARIHRADLQRVLTMMKSMPFWAERTDKLIIRTEQSPKINPHIYRQLILTKSTVCKKCNFYTNDAGNTGFAYKEKVSLDLDLVPYTTINSNMKCRTKSIVPCR